MIRCFGLQLLTEWLGTEKMMRTLLLPSDRKLTRNSNLESMSSFLKVLRANLGLAPTVPSKLKKRPFRISIILNSRLSLWVRLSSLPFRAMRVYSANESMPSRQRNHRLRKGNQTWMLFSVMPNKWNALLQLRATSKQLLNHCLIVLEWIRETPRQHRSNNKIKLIFCQKSINFH